ncbi:MAG: cytidine deaminase [Clostridia bacterium]|nr:cytidine deaminase [Clostridia bacterium]
MINELIEKAFEARENAYAPYSKFKVGAALLTANGKIYTGCNVENASYPVGICAERVAMSKAVAEGERKFVVIAIVGDGSSYCYPCGMCRQFMSEFCSEDFEIISVKSADDYKIIKMGELLPYTFNLFK